MKEEPALYIVGLASTTQMEHLMQLVPIGKYCICQGKKRANYSRRERSPTNCPIQNTKFRGNNLKIRDIFNAIFGRAGGLPGLENSSLPHDTDNGPWRYLGTTRIAFVCPAFATVAASRNAVDLFCRSAQGRAQIK
jgi:hypothetical protein